MKFGLNFGLLSKGLGSGSSTPIPNGCITQGQNGTQYGYDTSIPIGANTPDVLPSGQAIYANYWLTDGTFIMRFGDIGNEPIPDVEFIFTSIAGTLIQYAWDIAELRYQASNLTLATQLISDYVPDEDICYTTLPILQTMISYDMNITDVEGTNTLINNTSYSPHFDAPVINATQNGPGSILVDGTTDIDTGFKPSIPRYSIEETVTGELQDFGETNPDATFQADPVPGITTSIVDNVITVITDGTTSLIQQPKIRYHNSGGYVGEAFDATIEISCTSGSCYVDTLLDGNVSGGIDTKIINQEIFSGETWTFKASPGYQYENGGYFSTMLIMDSIGYIGTYTATYIYKKLTGTSQRTEQRLLTHDPVNGDKYYINGIEQSEVPALPDPDTTINLNDTAVIGYPDTIQSRSADFNVHTEIITS